MGSFVFSTTESARRYRYRDVLTTMFVVILLVSNLVATSHLFKVAYEVLATPATQGIIGRLKASEYAGPFDRHENFKPLPLHWERCGGSGIAANISSPFFVSFSHRGANPYHQTSHRVH